MHRCDGDLDLLLLKTMIDVELDGDGNGLAVEDIASRRLIEHLIFNPCIIPRHGMSDGSRLRGDEERLMSVCFASGVLSSELLSYYGFILPSCS